MDLDELRALAAGTPPAPSQVVALDPRGDGEGVEAPAAALVEARAAGCRATLRLRGTVARGDVAAAVQALAERLQREGVMLAPEALSLSAAVACPEEDALAAASACAGAPAVYLLLPSGALEGLQRRRPMALAGGGEVDARRWWHELLSLAAAAPSVSLVPEVAGAGLSLLAAGPPWLGPSPGAGELIPAAPRRLRLALEFRMLVAACNDCPEGLRLLAGRIVTMADELLGQLPGGRAPRRLALELDGIARAVQALGLDPRSFAALAWVRSRLTAFREGAREASVRLVRTRGEGLRPLPVPLEIADGDAVDRDMLMHGARHSHLLCLSPWSLAPPDMGRDGFGLLPALALADSVAWRRPAAQCPAPLYGEALRFAWAVPRHAVGEGERRQQSEAVAPHVRRRQAPRGQAQ
ncbi:MAG: hypothetical protein R6X32_15875, partial [Chloroflexota bacterium]